jgi:hypothetical protein
MDAYRQRRQAFIENNSEPQPKMAGQRDDE